MNFVPNAVSAKAAMSILKVKANSPTLLFGAGIVGVVTTTVLACRATLKLDETLEETQKMIKNIKELKHDDYSESDRKRDLGLVYVKTGLEITKLYSPAIIVGLASIAALGGSHHIMSKRNASLMAAYATLDKSFNEYRQRVLNDVGEKKEREYRHGVVMVAEEVVDENGHTKTVERALPDPNGVSAYAKFFDEFNPNWQPEPSWNRSFLQAQQQYANDMLVSRGHVFLNDVYDGLGMERTSAGAVVGWVISDTGDNFVDFGIFDQDRAMVRSFINGDEASVLLDFNVDGVIYDKIGKGRR